MVTNPENTQKQPINDCIYRGLAARLAVQRSFSDLHPGKMLAVVCSLFSRRGCSLRTSVWEQQRVVAFVGGLL